MNNSIIITGPQGCGKTFNKQALAKLFNRSILDNYYSSDELPNNVIALTHEAYPETAKSVIHFSTAMKLLKQFNGDKRD